jgi:LPXTG-motif cell wall-anchored protein
MKKSLTTIAVMFGILAFATPALAHTPSVAPSCSGLAVSLVSYEGSSPNNRVTTTIDSVATVTDFGGSYSHTFSWSQTVPHTWSVVIDANRSTGNATQYDRSFSGTWQACQTAPTTTTTVAPTTTTVAPTTTTDAPTTTTVAPAATPVEPTTTIVEAETPTTTTIVASEAPAAPTTTVSLVASEAPIPTTAVAQLPSTGYASGTIAILGLAMFGLGLALLGIRRRSHPVGG